ncbi:MAG: NADPH dehydrogenase NamA [Clostridiales Family XIII bacterium]|jgi:NADPH2 dehydrogenase|nr:NADPH dehydrogenase NamA [Clostridiales Family XIII bacterium]
MSKLFTSAAVKGLELKNRIVMPPMCMYSASDGTPTDWHFLHYATRAVGGAGLILLEATGVSPEGRISDSDLGLWSDKQGRILEILVSRIHANGAQAGIQLNHAGRKSEVQNAAIEAPSAIAYDEKSRVPAAMTLADIRETTEEFRQAAERANKAGFDALEIHAAHGYLLNQFLSPLTNRRNDDYGGSPQNRVRFLGEVLEAVSRVWPADKPIFVRVTAEEYAEGGNMPDDLAELLNIVKGIGNGIDVVDVSTGGLVPIAPKAFPGYQLPHARTIREKTGLPVIGGGLITTPAEAEAAIADGNADFVFIGRELLRNPYWPLHAALVLGDEVAWPKSYERARPRGK